MTDAQAIIAALEKDRDDLLAESNDRNNKPSDKRRYALLYSGVNRALFIAKLVQQKGAA